MCFIESSSFVAAGFSTLTEQVAGFHRAVPSTTLDKAGMQFGHILTHRIKNVNSFSSNSAKSSQTPYRLLSFKLLK